jgi:DNA end-binding protein Ku
MASRAIDKVTISFGLVTIPTRIYSTTVPAEEIAFHWLHAACGTRVKQQYVCPKDDEVVPRTELIKGYEYAKGRYVELTAEELEALEAQASDAIAIEEFVPADAVDPIFVDRSYYLGPDKGGDRAYALLARALEESKLVAVGSYAARGKSYLVLLRPFASGIVMHQLRYPDEIKPWAEIEVPERPRLKEAELGLARKLIEQLATDEFHPERYKDDVKVRVKKALAAKVKGGEITMPEPAPQAEVVDLMEALKQSLGGPAPRRADTRRAARRPTAAPRRRRARTE